MFIIILSFLATAVIATLAYAQTRSFVARRLRYVDAVQHTFAPVLCGIAAAVVAMPLVAIIPLLGLGTAAVYPTLIAQVSDLVGARERARAVGSYRLWRDLGYVAGAIIAGMAADRIGYRSAIVAVAALTAASGLLAGVLLRPQRGGTHARA